MFRNSSARQLLQAENHISGPRSLAKNRAGSIPDLHDLASCGRTNHHHKGERMTITMNTRTIPLITFTVALF
jgi:hypothetical protein